MKNAPIAFFAYKRYEHTLKALESLARNDGSDQSELYIFCDAAKRSEDDEAVKKVREVVRRQQWCGKVHVIERERNMGLANSIMTAVTDLCEQYGRVIVLEDDLVLSPYFLKYVNTALELYENCPRVMQVSGYMYPVQLNTETDAIFLPFMTSWGWATWQRAWNFFDSEMSGYTILKHDKKLKRQFNLNDSYPYFDYLEMQLRGESDSWAISWYLSTFMQGGVALYPSQSLVSNLGFDGSGTHCGNASRFNGSLLDRSLSKFPKVIMDDPEIDRLICRYIRIANSSKRTPKFWLARLLFLLLGNKTWKAQALANSH